MTVTYTQGAYSTPDVPSAHARLRFRFRAAGIPHRANAIRRARRIASARARLGYRRGRASTHCRFAGVAARRRRPRGQRHEGLSGAAARARVPSGGRVEVLLLERPMPTPGPPLVHPGQKLKAGARVALARDGAPGPVIEARSSDAAASAAVPDGSGQARATSMPRSIAIGHIPLPPYIHRDDTAPIAIATRPSTPRAAARLRRRPPACTSRRAPRAARGRRCRARGRDAPCRLRHLRAGARRARSRSTASTPSATRSTRPRRCG